MSGGAAVGVMVGVVVEVGTSVADAVGTRVVVGVADTLGVVVTVAVRVGVGVTARVGVAVGAFVGVDVADVGVRVGEAVSPGVWLPPVCTTSSTRLLALSEELKANPSELVVSSAADISEPALLATAEVTSIWSQTLVVVPGVNVFSTALFAGLLPKVIDPSVQVLSDTAFRLTAPPEPLVTNMRRVALETL